MNLDNRYEGFYSHCCSRYYRIINHELNKEIVFRTHTAQLECSSDEDQITAGSYICLMGFHC